MVRWREKEIFWKKTPYAHKVCISLTPLEKDYQINSIDWLKKKLFPLPYSVNITTIIVVWESWAREVSSQLNACVDDARFGIITSKRAPKFNAKSRVLLRAQSEEERELNFHHQDHLTLFHQKLWLQLQIFFFASTTWQFNLTRWP